MKSYKKPEIELVDVQIISYCDIVTPSSVGIDNPSEGAAPDTGNIFQVEIKDDL